MSKHRIHLPENALKQLQQERQQAIQLHLEELGKHQSLHNQALDQALGAELQRAGVPATAEAQLELLERCDAMAKRVALHKLRGLMLDVKALAKQQNVHDLPEHVVWSARRVGVEMFDAPLDVAPGLITEPH